MTGTTATVPARTGADDPIDVVMPFVDGRAPGFRALYERHCGPLVPCQVRSNGELRFALRSIERHAPWVRRVFLLVQDDGHVPPWLDRAAVTIVRHEALLPGEQLPTFLFQALALHTHHIDGLADRYLLFPDDVLFARPVSPALFFDGARPRFYARDVPIGPWTPENSYFLTIRNARRTLRAVLRGRRPVWQFPHVPIPLTRALLRAFIDEFRDDPTFATTLEGRRRAGAEASHVHFEALFFNWLDARDDRRVGACVIEALGHLGRRGLARARIGAVPPIFEAYGLFNDPRRTEASLRRMLRLPPVCACVNDEAYDVVSAPDGRPHEAGYDVPPDSIALLHRVLGTLLPGRSRFERA